MNWRGKGGDKKAEPGWGWEEQTHRERQTDVPTGERGEGRERTTLLSVSMGLFSASLCTMGLMTVFRVL